MPRLLHAECSPMPEYGCGHPVHEEHWQRGEVREVSAEAAEYLLATFGDCFEAVTAPAAAPGKPEVDRAMKPPAKKKAPPKKKAKK